MDDRGVRGLKEEKKKDIEEIKKMDNDIQQ